MVRIDRFIFGYRLITASKESFASLSSSLIRNKIQADIYPDGRIIISEKDFERFKFLYDKKIKFN